MPGHFQRSSSGHLKLHSSGHLQRKRHAFTHYIENAFAHREVEWDAYNRYRYVYTYYDVPVTWSSGIGGDPTKYGWRGLRSQAVESWVMRVTDWVFSGLNIYGGWVPKDTQVYFYDMTRVVVWADSGSGESTVWKMRATESNGSFMGWTADYGSRTRASAAGDYPPIYNDSFHPACNLVLPP